MSPSAISILAKPVTGSPSTSPSAKPVTGSPSTSPSTETTGHPFTGNKRVGGTNAGECADKDGFLFSCAEFDQISSPKACAWECSGLATSAQVGFGFKSDTCRCYFDGDAPDDEGKTFKSSESGGIGQVAGVNNASGENWQCYEPFVSREFQALDMFFEDACNKYIISQRCYK